jgi:mannose-6-phosphate isomerase-like protein (cupin superfamily)
VISGDAGVTLGEAYLSLAAGQTIEVPEGVWHRLANIGNAPLVLLELQTGAPDAGDIERREDDYGRA